MSYLFETYHRLGHSSCQNNHKCCQRNLPTCTVVHHRSVFLRDKNGQTCMKRTEFQWTSFFRTTMQRATLYMKYSPILRLILVRVFYLSVVLREIHIATLSSMVSETMCGDKWNDHACSTGKNPKNINTVQLQITRTNSKEKWCSENRLTTIGARVTDVTLATGNFIRISHSTCSVFVATLAVLAVRATCSQQLMTCASRLLYACG